LFVAQCLFEDIGYLDVLHLNTYRKVFELGLTFLYKSGILLLSRDEVEVCRQDEGFKSHH
jgi:hypothetical protein